MNENQSEELKDKLIETRHKLSLSDSFLEHMSRNVRGPLYSILEFSKIARDATGDKVAIEHYLDQINRAGHFMNESMDDTMAMRQVAMNDVRLHPENVCMGDLLKALQNDMAHIFTTTGVQFLIEDNEVADCVILTDYSILFQILRKMVRIVAELLPNKSSVILELKNKGITAGIIEIGFKVSGQEAVLASSVIQGLTDEYEAIEYNMYSNLDSMDPKVLILRAYTHEMGTDVVHVDTDVENGTKIYFSIKFPIVEKNELDQMNNRSFNFSQKRILVADDDEINLEIIDKLLREKGAEVITVRDGREALLTYRTEHGRFDLIMLDIVMPDMDGLTVAKKIRDTTTIPSSRVIPIVAMTVNAFHENYEQSLRAGMNSHLVKPIDSVRLYNTLAEFI